MPHQSPLDLVQSITLILLFAGIMGVLLSFLRVPGILAFILTGILIGPGGLGIVSNTETIHAIAEFGIIFLLFVLGAELSLPRLKEMRIHSLWAGVLQLALTIPVLAIGFSMFGLGLRTAIFLAGALALSSTAIVLKMLDEQGELETAHGRIAMGILIVQDLALVPLMAFMPLLSENGGQEGLISSFFWVSTKAGLFLGGIILLSWRLVPRLIDKVAAISNKEVFAAFVVAFSLFIAFVAEKSGLSYAVGAFIAGLALSRSITSRQIVAYSLPFRDILSTIFFVSVGMLMNTRFVFEYPSLILVVTLFIIIIKMLIVGLSVYLLRFPAKTIIWCGMSLFQIGEFSFILLQTGLYTGTINETILNTITSAIILSMLLTPLMIRYVPRILQAFESKQHLLKKIELPFPSKRVQPLKDEVVVAGYGPVAKNLIQVLQAHEIGFRVIEMNIQTVKQLQRQGIHCIFGDASSNEVLRHANLQEARVFAVTIPDVRAAELAIQNAKRMNPNIYCIVRSRYQQPLQTLFQLGADEVIYEEFETSMSFLYSVLDLFGDHVSDRESYLLLLRENRKNLLKAGKLAENQARYGRFSVFKETKVEWIAIPEGSPLIGLTLAEASLRQKTGINILAIVNPDGTEQLSPEPDMVLMANQVLVVIGTLEQLNGLESMLC